MAYQNTRETDIDLFQGALPRLGDYGIPLANGIYSQNAAYVHGQVSTRLGHSLGFTVQAGDGAVKNLYNWFFYFGSSPNSVVMYYAPAVGLRGYQQGFGITSVFIAVTGAAGSVMIGAGERLYAAFYDATGKLATAVGHVYVWNGADDALFGAPLPATLVATEPGAGVVTAGTRNIGFLPTTRTGFSTRLSPVVADVFTPIQFTSTGSKNLSVAITVSPLPSYMQPPGTFQLVMTTTTNLNRYYAVPGAIVSSFLGPPATIVADISDDDLTATGTDVTDYQNLLTNTLTVSPWGPPFVPSAIFTYSSRMGYVTIDSSNVPVVYISNKNDFQHIAADQNAIYLDALDKPVQGFSLGGLCYIGTPFAFYSCSDNGDFPVTWTPPQKVFGSVGILSPTCVAVNPAQTRALIASEAGFYLFQGGIFPALPLSYYQQPDWLRIDWTKPTQVQVADDQVNKRFIVLAPLLADLLGTNTSAAGTYEMTWDYTEGDTPQTVKYSINSYAAYAPAAITIVQNVVNSTSEPWTAPSAQGVVIRQNNGLETNPYRDLNTAGDTPESIQFLYETSLVPGDKGGNRATVHDFHGAHFRVTGAGNMSIQANGIDSVITKVPVRSPIALSLTPGIEELVKWFLRSEQQSIQIGTNGVDEFVSVSLIRAYWTNSLVQR